MAADLAQTPERANSEAIVIMAEPGEIAIAGSDAAAVAETEPKRPRVGGTMPLELKEKVEKSLLEIGEVEACGPYAFLGPFVRALCMGAAGGAPCDAWSAKVQEAAPQGTRSCTSALPAAGGFGP